MMRDWLNCTTHRYMQPVTQGHKETLVNFKQSQTKKERNYSAKLEEQKGKKCHSVDMLTSVGR